MDVLLLTIFLSLVLVSIFLVFYLGERRQRGFGSSEQDSLLPFSDEKKKDKSRD